MEDTVDREAASTSTGPKEVTYVTWKYHTNPEYREHFKKMVAASIKKRFEANPEYKAKVRENDRLQKKERYHTDPEYREKVLQRNREWHQRKKAEKLAADLEAKLKSDVS